MPTLSLKLPDETRQRLQRQAQAQGITAHALMVNAVEAALAVAENHNALVYAAMRARQETLASGQVVDGRAFGEYLKAKVRRQAVRKPRPIPLEQNLNKGV